MQVLDFANEKQIFQFFHWTSVVPKVNWTAEVFLEDLIEGKLPDLQVPKQVTEERFYQVSYQDQSVSVSFTIV